MSMLSDSDSFGGTSNLSKKPLIIAQTTFCFDFIEENDNSNLTQQIPLKQNNFSLYNCTITSTDTNKEELDLLHKKMFIDNDNSLNKSFSKSPKKFQIYNENIETIRPLTYDDLFGHFPEKDLEPFLTKNDNINEITIEPSKGNLHQNQRKSYDQIETQFEISQPEFVLSKEIPSSFDISDINTLASNHFNAESSINFELSEMTVLDSNFENIILNDHLFEISNKPNIFEISLQDENTNLKSSERQALNKTITFNIEEEEEENSDFESPTQRQPPQLVSNNDNQDIYYPINLTAFNNSKVPIKEFVLSDPEILITEMMNNYNDQHETRIERRNLSASFVVSDPFSIDHCISDSELRELLKMEEPPLEIDSNSDLVSLNIASVDKSLPLDISDMFCPTIEPEEIISHFELSQPNNLQTVLEKNINVDEKLMKEDLEICFVDDFSLSENSPFDSFTLEMSNNDTNSIQSKEINKIKSLIIQELDTFNVPEIPQNNIVDDDKGKNNIKLSLSNIEELNTSTLNHNLIIFEQSPITVNATVPLESEKSNLDIDINDNSDKQSRIEELEKENVAKQQDIDNKQQQIDELEKENEIKQEDINSKQQQIDDLEKENAAKQQNIDNKQLQIDELEKENAIKQEEIDSKQQQIDALKQENATKQQDIDDKQQHINELEKDITNKQNDINSKQQHIEELENIIRNTTEEPDSEIKDKELKEVNERTILIVSNFELNELVESKINNDNLTNSIEISQPESLISRLEEENIADDYENQKQNDKHEKPEVHISNAWLLESAETEEDLEKVTPNIDNKIALQLGNEIAPEINQEDNKIVLELGNEIASETSQTDEIEPETNQADNKIVLELGNEIAPEINQDYNKIDLQLSDEIVSEKSQTDEIEPEINQEEQTSNIPNQTIENPVANIELSYTVCYNFEQQMPILTTSIFNDIFSSSNSQIQIPSHENELQVSYPQISEIQPVESQITTEISTERNRLPTSSLSLSLPIEVYRQPTEIDDTFDFDQQQSSNENTQINRNVSLSPSPIVFNETSLQHPILSLSDPDCLFSPTPIQTEIDNNKNILFISEPASFDKEIEIDFTNSPISHIASIRLEKKQKQLDLQQQTSSNWSSWTDFDETSEQRNHMVESELQCIEINAKLDHNLEIDETENYELFEQIIPSVTREIQNIPQRRIKLEINESSIYCQESKTENEPKLKLIKYENFSKEPLELFKFPPDISPELNICNNEPTFEKVPQIEYTSTFTFTENDQVEIETQTDTEAETENDNSKSISDILYYEIPLTFDDESIVNNDVSNENQQSDENIEREQVEFSISTPEILPIETPQFNDLYENQPSTSIDDKSIIKYEQNDKPIFEMSDTVHENTFKQESHLQLSIVKQLPEFIELENKLNTNINTNGKSNEIGNLIEFNSPNEDTEISKKSVKSEITHQFELNEKTVIFDQSPSLNLSTTLIASKENEPREEISFSLSRAEILPIEQSEEQQSTVVDDDSLIKYEQNTTPIFGISDIIHKSTNESEESQNLNQEKEQKEFKVQSNTRIRGEIDNIISYDFTTKEEEEAQEEEKVQLEISNLNEYTKSEQTTEISSNDEYVKQQINLSITAQDELYEIFENKLYSTENEHQLSLINNINEIEIISIETTKTKKPKVELSDKIEQTTNDFEFSKFIEISPLTTIYEQEAERENTKSFSLIDANEIFNQTPNTIRSIPTDETHSEHRSVSICSTINSYEKYNDEFPEEPKETEEPNPEETKQISTKSQEQTQAQELSYSNIETFYIESQTTFELSSPLQYSIEYMRQQEEPKSTLLTNEGSYNSFEVKETETEEIKPIRQEQQQEHYQHINPTISTESNAYERFESNDKSEPEAETKEHISGINFSISKPEIIVEENETKDEVKQKQSFIIDEKSLLDVESTTSSPTFDLSETVHETAIEDNDNNKSLQVYEIQHQEPDFIDNRKESNDNQITNLLSFDYSLKPEDEEQTNTVQDQIPKQQITLSIEPQDELYQLFEARLCSKENNKQFSIISKINEFEIIPNKPTIKLSHIIEQSSFNDELQHTIELSPLNTVYEHQLIKRSNTISRIQEINIEPLELKHEIIHQKEDEITKQEQKNKLEIGNENHIELVEEPSNPLNISETTFLYEKKLRQKHKSESPETKNIHQIDFQHKHYIIEDIEPEIKPVEKGIELNKVERKLEINEETVIYDQSPASREKIGFPLEINESSIYCQESKTENEPKFELIRCEKENFSKEPLELFKFPPDISPELNICNNEPTFEKVPQIEYTSTFTFTENDQVEIETQTDTETETENQNSKSISDILYYETPLEIKSTPTIDDNSVINHEYNNFTKTHNNEVSNLLSYDCSINNENQQFKDQEISEKLVKSEITHQFELHRETVIFDQSPSPIPSKENEPREEISFSLSTPEILPIETSEMNNLTTEQEPTTIDENSLIKYEQNTTPIFEISDIIHENTFRQEQEEEKQKSHIQLTIVNQPQEFIELNNKLNANEKSIETIFENQQRDLQQEHFVIENIAPEIKIEDKENRFHFEIHPETIIYDQSPTIEINNQIENNETKESKESKDKKENEEEISFSLSRAEILPIETSEMNNLTSEQEPTTIDENSLIKYEQNTTPIFEISDIIHENTFKQEQEEEQKEFKVQSNTRVRGEIDNIISFDFTTKEEEAQEEEKPKEEEKVKVQLEISNLNEYTKPEQSTEISSNDEYVKQQINLSITAQDELYEIFENKLYSTENDHQLSLINNINEIEIISTESMKTKKPTFELSDKIEQTTKDFEFSKFIEISPLTTIYEQETGTENTKSFSLIDANEIFNQTPNTIRSIPTDETHSEHRSVSICSTTNSYEKYNDEFPEEPKETEEPNPEETKQISTKSQEQTQTQELSYSNIETFYIESQTTFELSSPLQYSIEYFSQQMLNFNINKQESIDITNSDVEQKNLPENKTFILTNEGSYNSFEVKEADTEKEEIKPVKYEQEEQRTIFDQAPTIETQKEYITFTISPTEILPIEQAETIKNIIDNESFVNYEIKSTNQPTQELILSEVENYEIKTTTNQTTQEFTLKEVENYEIKISTTLNQPTQELSVSEVENYEITATIQTPQEFTLKEVENYEIEIETTNQTTKELTVSEVENYEITTTSQTPQEFTLKEVENYEIEIGITTNQPTQELTVSEVENFEIKAATNQTPQQLTVSEVENYEVKTTTNHPAQQLTVSEVENYEIKTSTNQTSQQLTLNEVENYEIEQPSISSITREVPTIPPRTHEYNVFHDEIDIYEEAERRISLAINESDAFCEERKTENVPKLVISEQEIISEEPEKSAPSSLVIIETNREEIIRQEAAYELSKADEFYIQNENKQMKEGQNQQRDLQQEHYVVENIAPEIKIEDKENRFHFEIHPETIIYDQSPTIEINNQIESNETKESKENQSREEVSFSLSTPEILPIETSEMNNLTTEHEPTTIDENSLIKYEQNTTPIFEISDIIHENTFKQEQEEEEKQKSHLQLTIVNQPTEFIELDNKLNTNVNSNGKSYEIDNLIEFNYAYEDQEISKKSVKSEITHQFELHEETVIFDQSPSSISSPTLIASKENEPREEISFSLSTPEILPIETSEMHNLTEIQQSTVVDEDSLIKYEQNTTPIFEISDIIHENTFRQEHEEERKFSIENQQPEFTELNNEPIINTNTNEKPNEIDNLVSFNYSLNQELDTKSFDLTNFDEIFNQNPSSAPSSTTETTDKVFDRPDLNICYTENAFEEFDESDEQKETQLDENEIKRSLSYSQIEAFSVESQPSFELSSPSQISTNFGQENEEDNKENDVELTIGESDFYELTTNELEIDEPATRNISKKVEAFEIMELESFSFYKKDDGGDDEEEEEEDKNDKEEPANVDEEKKKRVLLINDSSCNSFEIKEKVIKLTHEQEEQRTIFDQAPTIETQKEHITFTISPTEILPIEQTETIKNIIDDESFVNYEIKSVNQPTQELTISEVENYEIKTTTNQTTYTISEVENFEIEQPIISSVSRDITGSAKQERLCINEENVFVLERKEESSIELNITETTNESFIVKESYELSEINDVFDSSKQQQQTELTICKNEIIFEEANKEEPKATLLTNEGSYNSFEVKETEIEEIKPIRQEQQQEHYQHINPTISTESNAYERFESNDEPEPEAETEEHISGINFSISKPEIIVEENETKDENKTKDITEHKQSPSISDDSITSFEIKETATQQSVIDEQSLLNAESSIESPSFELSEAILQNALDLTKSNQNEDEQPTANIKDRQITSLTIQHQDPEYIQIESKSRSIELSPLDVIYEDDSSPSLIVNHSAVSISETKEIFEQISSESSSNMKIDQNQTIFDQKENENENQKSSQHAQLFICENNETKFNEASQNNILQYSEPDSYFISDKTSFELSEPSQYSMRFLAHQQLNITEFEGIDIVNEDVQQNNKNDDKREAVKLSINEDSSFEINEKEEENHHRQNNASYENQTTIIYDQTPLKTSTRNENPSLSPEVLSYEIKGESIIKPTIDSGSVIELEYNETPEFSLSEIYREHIIRIRNEPDETKKPKETLQISLRPQSYEQSSSYNDKEYYELTTNDVFSLEQQETTTKSAPPIHNEINLDVSPSLSNECENKFTTNYSVHNEINLNVSPSPVNKIDDKLTANQPVHNEINLDVSPSLVNEFDNKFTTNNSVYNEVQLSLSPSDLPIHSEKKSDLIISESSAKDIVSETVSKQPNFDLVLGQQFDLVPSSSKVTLSQSLPCEYQTPFNQDDQFEISSLNRHLEYKETDSFIIENQPNIIKSSPVILSLSDVNCQIDAKNKYNDQKLSESYFLSMNIMNDGSDSSDEIDTTNVKERDFSVRERLTIQPCEESYKDFINDSTNFSISSFNQADYSPHESKYEILNVNSFDIQLEPKEKNTLSISDNFVQFEKENHEIQLIPKPIEKSLQTTNNDYTPVLFDSPVFHFGFSQIESSFIPSVFLEISEDVFEVNLDSTIRPLNASIEEVDQFSVDLSEPKKTEGSFIVDDENENISIILSNGLSYSYAEYYESINDNNIDEDIESLSSTSGDARLMLIKRQMKEISELHQENVKKDVTIESLKSKYINLKSAARECLMKHFSDVRRLTDDNVNLMEQVESLHKLLGSNLDSAQQSILSLMRKKIIASLEFSEKTTVFDCTPTKSSLEINEDDENVVDIPRFSSGLNVLVTFTNEDIEPSKNEEIFSKERKISNYKAGRLYLSNSMASVNVSNLSFSNLRTAGKITVFSQPPSYRLFPLKVSDLLNSSIFEKPETKNNFSFTFSHLRVSKPKVPPVLHLEDNLTIAHIFTSLPPSQNQQSTTDQQREVNLPQTLQQVQKPLRRNIVRNAFFIGNTNDSINTAPNQNSLVNNTSSFSILPQKKAKLVQVTNEQFEASAPSHPSDLQLKKTQAFDFAYEISETDSDSIPEFITTRPLMLSIPIVHSSDQNDDDIDVQISYDLIKLSKYREELKIDDNSSSFFEISEKDDKFTKSTKELDNISPLIDKDYTNSSHIVLNSLQPSDLQISEFDTFEMIPSDSSGLNEENQNEYEMLIAMLRRRVTTLNEELKMQNLRQSELISEMAHIRSNYEVLLRSSRAE